MIPDKRSQSPYYPVNTTMEASISKALPPFRSRTISPSPTMATEERASQRPSPAKRRRCLTFAPEKTLAYIETSSEMTQEEKASIWYQPSEMASFKAKARSLCRKRLHNSTVIPRHSMTSNRIEGFVKPETNTERDDSCNHAEESMRGMDAYLPARQKYSKRFVEHVLEAYHVRCAGNDEHVALLSEKWSQKAVKLAVAAGKKDFFMAYFPEEYEYEGVLKPNDRVVVTNVKEHLIQSTPIAGVAA